MVTFAFVLEEDLLARFRLEDLVASATSDAEFSDISSGELTVEAGVSSGVIVVVLARVALVLRDFLALDDTRPLDDVVCATSLGTTLIKSLNVFFRGDIRRKSIMLKSEETVCD
jgi:hypothetical protein